MGDSHLSGKNPICRKDNLVETQFKKLEEVIYLANKYNSPIINVGDLTDTPDLSYSVFSKTVSILSKCKNPIFNILGNHDLLYHNAKSLNSTALGAMINSLSNMHLIDDFYNIYNIPIDFCHWNQEINCNNGNIFISHKPILNSQLACLWYDEDYFSFEKMSKDYKVAICGHWHIQFFHRYNKSILINPGALTRRKASEENKKLVPCIGLLNLKDYNFKYITLKTFEKYEDVINETHLFFKKLKNKNIKNYLKKLKHSNYNEKLNIIECLITYINESENKEINAILEEILEEVNNNNINQKEI